MSKRDDIGLHVTDHGADRATLIGKTGTGKSTLGAYLLAKFRHDYPDARIIVMDTKPRWRAEWLWDGTSARKRYRRMAKGDTIPDSFALERPQDWQLVWHPDVNPSQTVVVQNLHLRQRNLIPFQVWCAEKFFRTQDANRPSLIFYDEGMDFYHESGAARGGSDIVQRCYRAGREMGLVTMFGAQRPIGINKQILSELNYCALFALHNSADVKRLWEYGWPKQLPPPSAHDPEDCTEGCVAHDEDGTFRLWRGGHTAPKYRLRIDAERKVA